MTSLSPTLSKLLIQQLAFLALTTYSNLFVNLYIWSDGKSVRDIALYNACTFVAWGLSYLLGQRIIESHSLSTPVKWSAVLSAVAFATLYWFNQEGIRLPIPTVAFLIGTSSGFYMSSFILGVSLYGKDESEFTRYFSLSAIGSQLISFLLPLLSALIIKFLGYHISFLTMIFFSVLLLRSSVLTPKVYVFENLAPEDRVFKLLSFNQVFNSSQLRYLFIAIIVTGIFMQFQYLFVLVYTFKVSSNEFVVALLNALYVFMSYLALTLQRRLNTKNQTALLTSGIILISLGFILATSQNTILMVVANCLTSFGIFYFSTINKARQYSAVNTLSTVHRARVFLWRELVSCSTRGLLLAAIFTVGSFDGISFIVFLVLAIVSAILTPFTHARMV